MRGYDHGYEARGGRPRTRYDYDVREFGRRPDQYTGWYPGAYWAGAPVFGWDGPEGWGWPPYVPMGHGLLPDDYRPRRRPRESAAYGRGGDEAARRWAERYGYDIEFSIHPRDTPRSSARYERDWREGRRAGW